MKRLQISMNTLCHFLYLLNAFCIVVFHRHYLQNDRGQPNDDPTRTPWPPTRPRLFWTTAVHSASSSQAECKHQQSWQPFLRCFQNSRGVQALTPGASVSFERWPPLAFAAISMTPHPRHEVSEKQLGRRVGPLSKSPSRRHRRKIERIARNSRSLPAITVRTLHHERAGRPLRRPRRRGR